MVPIIKLLLVSPFHGGSHRAWAEGLQKHSRAEIRILSLPARFWKWRMHGGSVSLALEFLDDPWQPDLIMATDMLDLSTFLALTRKKSYTVPGILYCHENQLTYPMPENARGNRKPELVQETDRHYPFINLTSMLAADRVIFNSIYHEKEFLAALPGYLRRFPETRLPGAARAIRGKSAVAYPGIEIPSGTPAPDDSRDEAPLIIWNQRWEYDKNPGEFFGALVKLKQHGLNFRLAVCGEQFSEKPAEITRALETLSSELVHCGYADQETYLRLLADSDIVFSTAIHEFFGISILEAVANRAFPILPARLSYPELIPEAFHRDCLYRTPSEMMSRLEKAIVEREWSSSVAGSLGEIMREKFSWPRLAGCYDQLFEEALSDRI